MIVIVNSTMVYYYKPDVACVRISNDKLWELWQEVTIVEYGNYLHESYNLP